MKVGDLIIVTSFTPEIVPEKLGIYIDDGVTNGAHENCLVLTQDGVEEVNSCLIFPVEHQDDQPRKKAKHIRSRRAGPLVGHKKI